MNTLEPEGRQNPHPIHRPPSMLPLAGTSRGLPVVSGKYDVLFRGPAAGAGTCLSGLVPVPLRPPHSALLFETAPLCQKYQKWVMGALGYAVLRSDPDLANV